MFRYPQLLLIVFGSFIAISFITNLMGPVFPAFISDFSIGMTLAGLFPFAMFIAYGLMSIPAGLLTERYGDKKILLAAFVLSSSAAALLLLQPGFASAMLSLFGIGVAMALLQVVINPLLRTAVGAASYPLMAVVAQLLFGLTGALTPMVYQWSHQAQWLQQGLALRYPWLALYLMFVVVSVVMLLAVLSCRFPAVQRDSTEQAGNTAQYWQLLQQPLVWRFFTAIFCYVALEQGIANSISVYLQQVHQQDPLTVGADTVAGFWLQMMLGCLVGLLFLRLFDSRVVLILFSLVSVVLLLTGIFADLSIARPALMACGASLSVMWSIIFALALNSVSRQQGALAGILCSAIAGGAVISPAIGAIYQLSGDMRSALCVLLLPLAYITSIGFWAKPLVTNPNWWQQHRERRRSTRSQPQPAAASQPTTGVEVQS